MEVYVQSRGVPQDLGYCWLNKVPSLIASTGIMELIQPESLSIVLARYSDQLLLLITGLESARQDFRGRTIKNSVAWICADTNREAEKQFRGIAIRALRGELASEVDAAIYSHNSHNFEFNKDRLQAIALEEKISSAPADPKHKIAHNCKDLQEELALELQYKALPSIEGPIVVVTGIKSEEALLKAGVWRASSNLIQAPSWEEISEGTSKKHFFLVAITMLLIVIAITTTALFLLYQDRQPQIQETRATNLPTPSKPSSNSSILSKDLPSLETLEKLSPSTNEF